jgi:hypothetical protein
VILGFIFYVPPSKKDTIFHINTELEEGLFYTSKSSSTVYKNNNFSSRQKSGLQMREISMFNLFEVAGLTMNELNALKYNCTRNQEA